MINVNYKKLFIFYISTLLPTIGYSKAELLWNRMKIKGICIKETTIFLPSRSFNETDPDFTLEAVMRLEMQKYSDQISEISNRASMELNIENVQLILIQTYTRLYYRKIMYYLFLCSQSSRYVRCGPIQTWPWNGITTRAFIVWKLPKIYYKCSRIIWCNCTPWRAQSMQLHDLNVNWITTFQCENVRFRYISIFIKEANYLEKSLTLIMEVLETILSVQRQYVYAEVNRSNVVVYRRWRTDRQGLYLIALCVSITSQKLKYTDAYIRVLYRYFYKIVRCRKTVWMPCFNQVALIVHNFCLCVWISDLLDSKISIFSVFIFLLIINYR